jgi:hypothetical protein
MSLQQTDKRRFVPLADIPRQELPIGQLDHIVHGSNLRASIQCTP